MGFIERHEHPGPNDFVIASGATESNWLRMAMENDVHEALAFAGGSFQLPSAFDGTQVTVSERMIGRERCGCWR